MTKEERLQELRKRKAYRRETELEDREENVGEAISPTEETLRLKKSHKTSAKATKVTKRNKLFSMSPITPKRKIKETMFIDEWHDACEVLPDSGEDVWFIFDEQIKVGVYEPIQRIFCMADGFGAELKDVRQWKYVGVEKQFLRYPKEHQVIACSVVGYPCLVTGIFTDHCIDEETYNETSAVILDEDYKGLDKAVDWKRVSYWYNFTEEPFVILDPVGDSILTVFPDTQTVIKDKTGVVIDSDDCCNSDDCSLDNSETSDLYITDSNKAEVLLVSDTMSQIKKASDKNKENSYQDTIKESDAGSFIDSVNSTVESAIKDATGNYDELKTQAGIGIKKGEETVRQAIDSYTSKKESTNMDKIYKVTEAQMNIITDYNLKENVKDWYTETYPTDDLGEEIRSDLTFQDVFDCLDSYENIYSCLEVYDSIVRERVFSKLAELIDSDYDYIYNQWLSSDENKPFVKDNSNIEIEYPNDEEEEVTEEQLNKMAKVFGLDSEFEKINKESEATKNRILTALDKAFKDFKIDLENIVNDSTSKEDTDENLDECIKNKVGSIKNNLSSLPNDLQESVISYLTKKSV